LIGLDRDGKLMDELVLLILIGFFAQLIDGALGMAFGVVCTTAMLAMGLPPAQASALVHTAEVFTTGASGSWHIFHRNVDWRLMLRLGGAGVVGAVLGAWILSNVDASFMRPFVAGYLLLVGIYILLKAGGRLPTEPPKRTWSGTVGFVGGFLDASGGGGWGPVTASWLVGAGLSPRIAIGSVNTAEFVVTLAAATTFFVELGSASLQYLVPLVLGGLFAAPFGGLVVKVLPARVLMFAVGVLIVLLSLFQLGRAFGLI
jgi:uncharacterized membrane protein YfcA